MSKDRLPIQNLTHVRDIRHLWQGGKPNPQDRIGSGIGAGIEARIGKPQPQANKESPLEVMFAELWAQYGNGMEYEREYPFMRGRLYRFDFFFPPFVAVEVDGGQKSSYGGGRHNSDTDRWKLNYAASLGFRVLRFSRAMMEDEPSKVAEVIIEALQWTAGS